LLPTEFNELRAPGQSGRARSWLPVLAAAGICLPAIVVRLGLLAVPLPAATALYGIAVVGAAFLLTWAAEAAERDISGSIAVALLALVAVLPEYAVDMSFAWTAGRRPEYAAYAAANMTGANRLVIGVGWVMVVFVFWLKTRRSLVVLASKHRLELGMLAAATLYSFTIPLKHSLAPFDSVVLIGLFFAYLWLAARGPVEEVELIGPASQIGALPRQRRRGVLLALFLFAAAIILLVAEAFAQGLVETGASLGVDRFLLVQWVAPLASEAPEFIAAFLLCLRSRPGSALSVLLSSAVNQWTLLIGGLPLAYSAGHGALASLPLDMRQTEEVLLTAAQSLCAIALLAGFSLSLAEAALLFVLFLLALLLGHPAARWLLSAVYLAIAATAFVRLRFKSAKARA
jgi:cation:H+ antiporter